MKSERSGSRLSSLGAPSGGPSSHVGSVMVSCQALVSAKVAGTIQTSSAAARLLRNAFIKISVSRDDGQADRDKSRLLWGRLSDPARRCQRRPSGGCVKIRQADSQSAADWQ